MVAELCFEVSGIKNLIDTCREIQKIYLIPVITCFPKYLVTKLTLKTLLDHKDNLIHLGSLLVSYFSATHTHTLIRSGNHY